VFFCDCKDPVSKGMRRLARGTLKFLKNMISQPMLWDGLDKTVM
jgi:hypothetical protein